MDSPYGGALSIVTRTIGAALKDCKYDAPDFESTIQESKGIGDISCSVAFRIARERKEKPVDVAKKISDHMIRPKGVAKVTVENGYINFHLERETFTKEVLGFASALDDAKPVSGSGKGERVIIEYPSVNPNKPWHLGHLRNALLGSTIANLHGACGYEVEREDYIDDLGAQVVESLWGCLNLGSKPTAKFDLWLGEEYVKVHKMLEEKPDEMKPKLSKLMQLIEQDGTSEAKKAREVSELCVQAQNETAFKYRVYHDVMVWESDIIANKLLKQALEIMERKKFTNKPKTGEYKGCIVVDLNSIEDLPEKLKNLKENIKVLVRSDGTPTYVAKDIAFHMWKFGMIPNTFKYTTFIDPQPNGRPMYTTSSAGKNMDFGNVKKAINIIDSSQGFEQLVMKTAFAGIGRRDIADGIHHVAYGLVTVEGGSLSGRTGGWMAYTADLLIEEAKSKALSLIGDRFKLDKKEEHDIASKVALSAVRFEFLKIAPEKDLVFSWQKALNFEGNSGPYCMYTYARASRMLRDAKFTKPAAGMDSSIITSDHEFQLIKQISKLSEVVEKACVENRPNSIAEYASDLALMFSKFYEAVPVLKAKTEREKAARLALTFVFASTMRYALSLMGIPVVERM